MDIQLQKLKELMSDKEWEELILLALGTGMTVEEIKEFFHQPCRP
ncbi:DNA-binding anti-repressor SinI [Metabacillus fastidiosus]|uniref:DNA-binding anti-repressor SinI n=1 Tax=Metabacillus fastidiosus TaxID=1458 RepID=A0ABU6P0H4_9BACI|nr:DNA-binding anti-repressor SinI [Metabacillus fastidiosus]MED4402478.1 DNA-binding anti-repressor SinI [Metabacillus fastidiosus]MED4453829.1 DNA-binding anti-repressor SinI [Metabacillus fastidiosus]MED4461765.1 DNA-binding anti-repressor SinI [Metabacillus fastidiosus]